MNNIRCFRSFLHTQQDSNKYRFIILRQEKFQNCDMIKVNNVRIFIYYNCKLVTNDFCKEAEWACNILYLLQNGAGVLTTKDLKQMKSEKDTYALLYSRDLYRKNQKQFVECCRYLEKALEKHSARQIGNNGQKTVSFWIVDCEDIKDFDIVFERTVYAGDVPEHAVVRQYENGSLVKCDVIRVKCDVIRETEQANYDINCVSYVYSKQKRNLKISEIDRK